MKKIPDYRCQRKKKHDHGEILELKNIHIIIDGKALRGATEKVKNDDVPYILNAIDAATKLVIAQLSIAYKKNEISTIPQLMDLFDLDGNIISIDAIGTQNKIIDHIKENNGHYLLSVKSNQLSLFEEIKGDIGMVRNARKQKDPHYYSKIGDNIRYLLHNYETDKTCERNRERMEYRSIEVIKNISLSSREDSAFDSIKTIGLLKRVRIPVEKDHEGKDITVDYDTFIQKGSAYHHKASSGENFGDDIEVTGLISDIEMSAKQMMKINREHWAIENSLHHCLDVSFNEDRSPATKSKGNLSLVRKIAYNLLRISMIRENIDLPVIERMDDFADDFSLLEKYVLNPIESFY